MTDVIALTTLDIDSKNHAPLKALVARQNKFGLKRSKYIQEWGNNIRFLYFAK